MSALVKPLDRPHCYGDEIGRTEDKSYLVQELLGRDNPNTPDYLERKLEKHIPVFVYGTLRPGGRLHSVIKGCPSLGEAYTATPTFSMSDAYGSFPVAFNYKNTSPQKGNIYGDVFVVDAKTLLELDRVEDNGEMYQRELKFVFLVNQAFRGKNGMVRPAIKTWVYLGRQEYWKTQNLEPVEPRTYENKTLFEWKDKTPIVEKTDSSKAYQDYLKSQNNQYVSSEYSKYYEDLFYDDEGNSLPWGM